MAPQAKRQGTAPAREAPSVNIDRIRVRIQGWFLRTLRLDTTGEYGKLKRLMELFLLQAERRLACPVSDRGTEVAVEEALRHLGLRWGPKFREPLLLDVRVTDTHLKVSLTVPVEALVGKKRATTSKVRLRQQAAAERSLYVVRRLASRLHLGPAGRQLVFWCLLRRSPGM